MIKIEDIPEDKIVIYDIETTGQNAAYCKLKMLAYQHGINGEPMLVDLTSKRERKAFARLVGNPDIIKVSFNGINFDDVVLWRYGMWINPENRHDMYLALKTIHPTWPSYSLKATNLLMDMEQSIEDAWHEPEFKLHEWLVKSDLEMGDMYISPPELLELYCKHDVRQTCNVFRALWETIQQPEYWRPYKNLELAMGEPLHEMILLGREYIDLKQVRRVINEHEALKAHWVREAKIRTNGKVQNIASNQQLTHFLKEEFKLQFAVSEAGHYLLTKSDKLQILEDREHIDSETLPLDKWLIYASYEVFDITKVLGYFRAYLRAGEYEQQRNCFHYKRIDGRVRPINNSSSHDQGGNRSEHNERKRDNTQNSFVSIPKGYQLSAARTRRFRSASRFSYQRKKIDGSIEEIKWGINWQNQNKRSKIVQLVPKGWLGFWLDSTQIENVTHIWASEDNVRRAAYEADENWNEYVWLSNQIIGGELSREEQDRIVSDVNPAWSVYKQYKTIKLALNFGLGPNKFAKHTGLDRKQAKVLFERVHKACPAIRKLQRLVKEKILRDGYILDPFGHRYSGNVVDEAYKVVAYLIQGCGTGSIPKAMTVANYRTIHNMDSHIQLYRPNIFHPYRKMFSFGVLTGTTHDECAGRISLGMPEHRIIDLIHNLLYNMEGRFSKLFGGIPLRAKLSLSKTNAAEAKEINHHAMSREEFENQIRTVINT